MRRLWKYHFYALEVVVAIQCLSCAALRAERLEPRETFGGKVAPALKDSISYWPKPPSPPPDAPNIVIILLDDIGFGDTGSFGGLAETPELDKLIAQGVRYTNFNTTGTCSPTRAALLSGRNHHKVGFGFAEVAAGFPGYNFMWKRSAAPVSEVLRRSGYSTAAFGKWHNTPSWEVTPVGPFDRWPTSLGFEHFYGFIAGMDDQWEPMNLFRNTTPVQMRPIPDEALHLTTDLANEAISWLFTLQSLAEDRPYFLYFAPGAAHWPHQAPRIWIDKYRGRFDDGWDKIRQRILKNQKHLGVVPEATQLTPRPDEIPAWDALSADQKRIYSRQMEVYAGFISHTDYEVGRLLSAIHDTKDAKNTIIIYILSDNGPSPEGNINGFRGMWTLGRDREFAPLKEELKHLDELGAASDVWNHYSAGWAFMGSTPFRWWKAVASHFGATRSPLVVSWPARIKPSSISRQQFVYVTDIVATLYEITGIPAPIQIDGIKQLPLDGVSFSQTFDDASDPSQHRSQYFEMAGNRAMYQDGWIASARHEAWFGASSQNKEDFSADTWELYRTSVDFNQSNDVSKQYPDKLDQLKELFDSEARRNDVYPLGAGTSEMTPQHRDTSHKQTFKYYGRMARMQKNVIPNFSGRSYRVTATMNAVTGNNNGTILACGGRESGFAFYLKDGRLYFENNPRPDVREMIVSESAVPSGSAKLVFDFTLAASSTDRESSHTGIGRILINDTPQGQARLTEPFCAGSYSRSLGVGEAFASMMSHEFSPPFKLECDLTEVHVELR